MNTPTSRKPGPERQASSETPRALLLPWAHPESAAPPPQGSKMILRLFLRYPFLVVLKENQEEHHQLGVPLKKTHTHTHPCEWLHGYYF